MKTSVKTIRKNIIPPTLSCSVYAKSSSGDESKGFGTKQVYYSSTGTYSPNRDNSHYLILQPEVKAFSRDGSIGEDGAAVSVISQLTNIKWLYSESLNTPANSWLELSDTNNAGLTYEIKTTGADRGQLLIKSNMSAGNTVYFRFTANYKDPRNSKSIIAVTSQPVTLSCIQNDSLDQYRLFTEDNLNIMYNPLDYQSFNLKCQRTIYFKLMKGQQVVNFEYANEGGKSKLFYVAVYKGNTINSNNLVADSAKEVFFRDKGSTASANADITNIGYITEQNSDGEKTVSVYLKLNVGIKKTESNYLVALIGPDPTDSTKSFVYDTKELTIKRTTPAIDATNMNNTPYVKGQTRRDKCIVSVKGAAISYPSHAFAVNWCFGDDDGNETTSKFNDGESHDMSREVTVNSVGVDGSVNIQFPEGYNGDGFTQWFDIVEKTMVEDTKHVVSIYTNAACTARPNLAGSYSELYIKFEEDIQMGTDRRSLSFDTMSYTQDKPFLELVNNGTAIEVTYHNTFLGTITPSSNGNVLPAGVYKLTSATASSISATLSTSGSSTMTNFL